MSTGRSIRIETLDLKACPSHEAARQAFRQIKPVHDHCWPEADFEKALAIRLDPTSVHNQLFLARELDGRVVGFGHAMVQDVEAAGTSVRLMRFFTGVLPEWRTTAAGLERLTLGPFIGSAVQGLLRGRLPVVYFFIGTPSAYRTVLRLSPRMIPSPGKQSDPVLLRLRDVLAEQLGLERVPGRAHACYGPKLAMSKGQRDFWKRHSAPEVQFFLEQCPGFGDGEYLLGLVPVTWRDIAQVPFTFVAGLTREWLRRRRRRNPPASDAGPPG